MFINWPSAQSSPSAASRSHLPPTLRLTRWQNAQRRGGCGTARSCIRRPAPPGCTRAPSCETGSGGRAGAAVADQTNCGSIGAGKCCIPKAGKHIWCSVQQAAAPGRFAAGASARAKARDLAPAGGTPDPQRLRQLGPHRRKAPPAHKLERAGCTAVQGGATQSRRRRTVIGDSNSGSVKALH